MINRVLIVAILFIHIGCSNQLEMNQYIAFINDPKNGLIKKNETNGYEFICEYKPVEYLAIIESQKSKEKLNFEKLNQYKTGAYLETFYLKICTENETDFLKFKNNSRDDYFKRLNYFNGSIQNSLFLVSEIDTIPCNYSFFERNFGSGKYSTLIVVFESDQKLINETNFQLIFKDEILGLGQINFNFNSNDLKNIPEILI